MGGVKPSLRTQGRQSQPAKGEGRGAGNKHVAVAVLKVQVPHVASEMSPTDTVRPRARRRSKVRSRLTKRGHEAVCACGLRGTEAWLKYFLQKVGLFVCPATLICHTDASFFQ